MKIGRNQSFSGTESLGMGQNYRSNQGEGAAQQSDEELVEQCRKGEFAAFGEFVERYQDRLFNALLRMVNNYDDAQELAQETFMRALQGIGKFRGGSGFYTWLFRIGMNQAINFHRRRRTVKFTSLQSGSEQLGEQAEGLLHLIESRTQSPVSRAQVYEEHQRVLEAMDKLEPAARAVVVLRDIEDFDYSEIAAILEIPVGTVKSRLARARMSIRERLGQQGRDR